MRALSITGLHILLNAFCKDRANIASPCSRPHSQRRAKTPKSLSPQCHALECLAHSHVFRQQAKETPELTLTKHMATFDKHMIFEAFVADTAKKPPLQRTKKNLNSRTPNVHMSSPNHNIFTTLSQTHPHGVIFFLQQVIDRERWIFCSRQDCNEATHKQHRQPFPP